MTLKRRVSTLEHNERGGDFPSMAFLLAPESDSHGLGWSALLTYRDERENRTFRQGPHETIEDFRIRVAAEAPSCPLIQLDHGWERL